MNFFSHIFSIQYDVMTPELYNWMMDTSVRESHLISITLCGSPNVFP
jgi:hypothetical protein